MQRLNSICAVKRDSITAYPACHLLPIGHIERYVPKLESPTIQPSSHSELFLLLLPFFLGISWSSYFATSITCLRRQEPNQLSYFPLLLLAAANPWLYGKLPRHKLGHRQQPSKIKEKLPTEGHVNDQKSQERLKKDCIPIRLHENPLAKQYQSDIFRSTTRFESAMDLKDMVSSH